MTGEQWKFLFCIAAAGSRFSCRRPCCGDIILPFNDSSSIGCTIFSPVITSWMLTASTISCVMSSGFIPQLCLTFSSISDLEQHTFSSEDFKGTDFSAKEKARLL
uniref:Uncharacterized protein n=1 Tax=Opuntia streptacantha TaxID=393608 RepID=A0A7C9CYM8_OPUST